MLEFISIAAAIYGLVNYERLAIKNSVIEVRDEKISKLEKELSVSEKLSKEKDGLLKKLEEENFKLKRGW